MIPGHIGIQPIGDLAQTASMVGEVLGIEFVEDGQATYDEFPAFIAEAGAYKYALLGNPPSELDIRDDPCADFELILEPQSATARAGLAQVSADLINKISTDGRIRCRSLD